MFCCAVNETIQNTPKVPSFILTPQGIRAHLPVYSSNNSGNYAIAHLYGAEITIKEDQEPHQIWLILELQPSGPRASDEAFPIYNCSDNSVRRHVLISPEVSGELEWKWQDIYIRPWPEYRPSYTSDIFERLSRLRIAAYATPFVLGREAIKQFEEALRSKLINVTLVRIPWTGEEPVTLTFRAKTGNLDIEVVLGQSWTLPTAGETEAPAPRYIMVRTLKRYLSAQHTLVLGIVGHMICATTTRLY